MTQLKSHAPGPVQAMAYPRFHCHGLRASTQGKLKYREHVVEGLSKAPEALIGFLRGENFGKLMVKVAAPV
jgi:NADPH-dependent curcumin reductase